MLGVGDLLGRGATILLTLMIARTCGIAFLADLSLAQSLLAYAAVAADAGLTAHAVRRLSEGDDEHTVIRETSSVQLVLCLGSLAVILPLAAGRVGWQMALLLALHAIATSLAPTYVLQATRRYGRLATSRAFSSLLTCAAGVAILAAGVQTFVPAAYSVGAVGAMAIVVYASSKSFRRFFCTLTLRIRRSWILAAGWLIPQTVIVHAYASFLLVASGFTLDASGFVLLATALKFQSYLVIPATLFQTVLLAAFVRGDLSVRKASAGVGLVGLVVTCFAYSLAPHLLALLFGEEARSATGVARLVCLQVPFAYLSTVMLAALVARGKYGLSTAVYGGALVALALGCLTVAARTPERLAYAFVGAEVLFVGLLATALLVGRIDRDTEAGKRRSNVR